MNPVGDVRAQARRVGGVKGSTCEGCYQRVGGGGYGGDSAEGLGEGRVVWEEYGGNEGSGWVLAGW